MLRVDALQQLPNKLVDALKDTLLHHTARARRDEGSVRPEAQQVARFDQHHRPTGLRDVPDAVEFGKYAVGVESDAEWRRGVSNEQRGTDVAFGYQPVLVGQCERRPTLVIG